MNERPRPGDDEQKRGDVPWRYVPPDPPAKPEKDSDESS